MDYCAPKGLPLSEFLSWPPADQENALWWQAYESRRCGACGTHPDEWEDPDAYHAESYTCPGCEKTATARDALGDKPGVHLRLAAGGVSQCVKCRPRKVR